MSAGGGWLAHCPAARLGTVYSRLVLQQRRRVGEAEAVWMARPEGFTIWPSRHPFSEPRAGVWRLVGDLALLRTVLAPHYKGILETAGRTARPYSQRMTSPHCPPRGSLRKKMTPPLAPRKPLKSQSGSPAWCPPIPQPCPRPPSRLRHPRGYLFCIRARIAA